MLTDELLLDFKKAILKDENGEDELERCFAAFLDEYDYRQATIFYNLLKIAKPTPRISEILKIFDFVRFPVKRPDQFSMPSTDSCNK